MLSFEGKKTSLQPGDQVMIDLDLKLVSFLRGTQALRFCKVLGEGDDNKRGASFIEDERDFFYFVRIIADVAGLGYSKVKKGEGHSTVTNSEIAEFHKLRT